MTDRVLSGFSRLQLARLGREYMLASQFNSRAGYGALKINHGDEAYKDVAIENWMAVSPIYTQRMQRAMGIEGNTDVATIFKGLQLDCGFTHQYFDVRFEVFSKNEGRFWLQSCGALLDAEQRGEEAVRTMCHDVEDPTFDATAVATNPRARMHAVHRPPRHPVGRSPHCEWQVIIDPDAEPLKIPAVAEAMQALRLATLPNPRPPALEPGGMTDYQGPVIEQLQLEQLSHDALQLVCKELAIQCQLLTIALFRAIESRYGREAAVEVAAFQMAGSGWVVSERLSKFCNPESKAIDRVLEVLAIHPLFQPANYIAMSLTRLSDQRARLVFEPCEATEEEQGYGCLNLLKQGFDDSLACVIKGIDPRAKLTREEAGAMIWLIELQAVTEAVEEPLSVRVAKSTVLYQTRLQDHIPLLSVE